MTAAILLGVTVVLAVLAAYVGVLLVRRSKPSAATSTPPQTVRDLIARQSSGDDQDDHDDLSGSDLFAPTEPRTSRTADGARTDQAAKGPDAAARTVEVAVPLPVPTPPGGVEAGDAPWRRAARMMGSEPGGAWETAPLPVAPAEPAASVSAASASGASGSAAKDPTPDEAGRTAVMAVPARSRAAVADPAPDQSDHGDTDAVQGAPTSTATPAGPALTLAAPADAVNPGAAPVGLVPVDPPSNASDPSDASGPSRTEPARSVRTAPRPAPSRVGPKSAEPAEPAEPAADEAVDSAGSGPRDVDVPSRPLSDPDLTPLMGIPIVRPLGSTSAPAPADADAADRAPESATPEPDLPDPEPVPAVSRLAAEIDDEVVLMIPATTPAEQPAVVTGSPQPVWFRVVRRDGEPVAAGVVALLDDHGREVDTTKTATDGGGELHAPHSGRFLMVASADGFQPRAVILTVEEQPVEIALLLPRSAVIAGVASVDGSPAAGVRVVAFQEGEVVDDVVTTRDGRFRFDDLVEGAYALSATHARGDVVRRVTLSEGTDLELDLDLTAPAATSASVRGATPSGGAPR